MSSAAVNHRAHRCSFEPGRQDLYLRLGSATVFVRDLERSRRFYVEQLGFDLASEACAPSGDRRLAVSPPDGTAVLTLVAPEAGSEECKLIGGPTHIAFLTENVAGKYEEWSERGVTFLQGPQRRADGGACASFADLDGNAFLLVENEATIHEIEEQRRAHVERMEAERMTALELENAREAQARLFPQTPPALATLECAGICVQARTVGGDYYDFLELGQERVGLVVGDISGKGTAAALLMANLQAHLRNLSSAYSSRPYTPFALEQPQRLLQAVNRLFCDNTAEKSYATLLFAEYDDTTRRLRYANCGHLPALVLRGDDSLEHLNPTNTVVGLFKQWNCSVGESQLSPGDTLVLYTDGITESFNEAEEEFGEERVVQALRRSRELEPSALLHSLLNEVRRFSPRRQHDDITLVAARCR